MHKAHAEMLGKEGSFKAKIVSTKFGLQGLDRRIDAARIQDLSLKNSLTGMPTVI
jgi:hypothetical protein